MSIRDWLLGHSFIDPVDVCQTYGHDFTMTSDDGPASTWQCNDCEVVSVGRKYVHVAMDRSGRTRKFSPDSVIPVD